MGSGQFLRSAAELLVFRLEETCEIPDVKLWKKFPSVQNMDSPAVCNGYQPKTKYLANLRQLS